MRPSPPFFIVGCPRSGTTLLRRILDCHSRLAVFHESQYYPLFRADLHRYGDLRQRGRRRRLIADLLEAARLRGEEAPTLNEVEEALVEPTFEGIFATWLHLYALNRGKARGGDKTPQHHAFLDEILDGFPLSPVIFLVRDPRDTVLSMHRNFGWSLEGAAREWNRAAGNCRRASRPVHLVRYEELVHRPAEIVQGICAFLAERYEPAMLRFHERPPAGLSTPRALQKLTRPVDAGSVATFHALPLDRVRRIEDACAEGMEALGYAIEAALRAAPIGPPPESFRSEPTGNRVSNKLLDRLRFYGLHRHRWRWGWFRWKVMLRLRVRHALACALQRLRLPGA